MKPEDDKKLNTVAKNIYDISRGKQKKKATNQAQLIERLNDAQLMSDIRERILLISDEAVKKTLYDCWHENAVNLGMSKFKK